MRRAVRATVAAAFLISIGLVATAPPAAAGSFCNGSNHENAPDGKIKIGSGAFQGAGIYPQTGLGVVRGIGEQAVFKLKWKNVAGDNLTIRVNLHLSFKAAGFGVRFFVHGTNVSSILKGGDALVFHNIAPGEATPVIELVVKNKSASSSDTFQYLRGRYQGSQPNRCDMLVGDVDAEV